MVFVSQYDSVRRPASWLVLASLLAALLASLLGGCKTEASRSTGSTNVERGAAPANGEVDLAADDGQWVRPAKDLASTRFSGLTEINTTNVKNLRVIATFSTGTLRGHEAAPIVVGNTMYIITPYPNYVYALDLTKPGLPTKWMYNPKPELASQGVACCDVVNRGLVYDNGKLFFNTLDDHTIALDAATGKEVWNTKVGDINMGETITMAPLVAKGKVLVGDSGGEMGVRGWLKALDATTGTVVWTAYHTGPDKDVLIGPDFKPFYAKDKGKDLGVSSWPPDGWKIGGGTMWGWISYDSTSGMIFYGSANPGPWNPDQRPGDNKWTSTLFARKIDDGQAVWAYQLTQHDLHDYDGINEQILADLTINGAKRAVLIRPDRNGYVYVVDRKTGSDLGESVRVHQLDHGRRSQDRRAAIQSREGDDARQGRARNLSGGAGHEGLATLGLFAQTRLVIHSSSEFVYGRGRPERELHRGHAVRRHEREDVSRSGRQSRRVPGVESRHRQGSLVDQGRSAGVERHGGDGRRRRLLRHDGRMVQGRRCAHRQHPVAVQDRLRHHRPANHVQGT